MKMLGIIKVKSDDSVAAAQNVTSTRWFTFGQ